MPSEARVLSVGCRFETELLYLLAYGYRFIRGIDIFSYSPWVDVGDMHAMPYEDSTWDCVLLGWVISYSKTPHTAASEVLRVIRDGGIVAVAVSYYPDAQLEEAERQGTLIGSRDRLQTVDALLNEL